MGPAAEEQVHLVAIRGRVGVRVRVGVGVGGRVRVRVLERVRVRVRVRVKGYRVLTAEEVHRHAAVLVDTRLVWVTVGVRVGLG